MPGPVESDETPYVPSWCYPRGPKLCPCGHHEGFHNSHGVCLQHARCGCTGLPAGCLSSDEELLIYEDPAQ